jgi:hypothetical protein
MIPTHPGAELRRLAAGLFWSLVATAIFVEQLADTPADANAAVALGAALGWTAWGGLLRFLATRVMRGDRGAWRPAALLAIAAAAILPPVALAGWSAVTGVATCPGIGGGTSPEGLLLACLRGLLLTLLAVGLSAGEVRFAAATSLFLVAVSLIVVEHPVVRAGVAGYALLGGAWLVAARTGPGAGRQRDPGGLVAALAVAVTVASIGGSVGDSGRSIAGFVPLSGGQGWAYPWARGGSGDGEDLIAARGKPTATGPVDSDLFVTSHKPTLYDLMTDLYGEPEKPKKDDAPKRTVGLGPEETLASETHLPDTTHAGLEFSTARRGGSPRRPRGDVPTRALVMVSGPAPVHLRLEAFEAFDGRRWLASPTRSLAEVSGDSRSPHLEHVGGAWMRWQPPGDGCEDGHEVTVGALSTPVVPLPAHTTGLRIDRVERSEFFREPQPGLVSLETVDVPSGTIIETRSKAGGVAADMVAGLTTGSPPALCIGGSQPGWVAKIVQAWNLPRDGVTWEAAATVMAAIERHCTLDHTAGPPADGADTLEHFLTTSRRGPDYCFAGAAVLLLRELGFDTRLVSGLYLSGERRDPRSRKLVAASDDAHFWAEIRDADGCWVPVEATPGYSLREPVVVWWRPLGTWLSEAGSAVVARPIWLLAAAAVSAIVALMWRTLVDAAVTAAWQLAVRRAGRCQLRATWRLIEWRAWLAGRSRPQSATPRGWYLDSLRLNDPAAAGPLGEFIAAYEQSVYGPVAPGSADPAARSLARTVTAQVTRGVLTGRSHRRPAAVRRWFAPLLLKSPA